MHLVGNNSSMQPTPLWSVGKSVFCPCYLFLLWNVRCTKMPCPLPHNHYCCSLPSPICLPHLLIGTCLISSPIACPPSSVLCWCLLCFLFLIFLLYVAFLCDFILACLCTYFLLSGSECWSLPFILVLWCLTLTLTPTVDLKATVSAFTPYIKHLWCQKSKPWTWDKWKTIL